MYHKRSYFHIKPVVFLCNMMPTTPTHAGFYKMCEWGLFQKPTSSKRPAVLEAVSTFVYKQIFSGRQWYFLDKSNICMGLVSPVDLW